MDECIERESILKRFSSYIEDFGYGERQNKKLSQISIEDAMMIIEDEPAADVRPERHGRWEIDMNGGFRFVKCSECGRHPRSNLEELFCPWCGAKMDGKDGGQNDKGR